MSITQPQWPPAVEVVNGSGASPFILLCPHASNYIPAEYHNLGLPPAELERHIAWDIGAAGVTRRLSEALDAPAFLGTYSRLLIDLNRPLNAASSIVTRSESTDIPGNVALDARERERRATRIFTPFHDAIQAHLSKRTATRRPPVIVAIHSFTPAYHGVARPWHVGVLFAESGELAQTVIRRLRARDEALNVDANVPYTVTPESDYALLIYGDGLGNPAIEFEIRQDLLTLSQDQRAWAERLADALVGTRETERFA
jgi:predicted N-formylglutamate amidohydrolase